MTVRGSEESVEARLRSGLLVCWCGGTALASGRGRRGARWGGRVGGAGRRRGEAVAGWGGGPGGWGGGSPGWGRGGEHGGPPHGTGGLLPAPPLPALAGNTTLIAMAAVPPS